MNDDERTELIFKHVAARASQKSEDELREFYVENMSDWYNTWDDDELLELSGQLPMGEL